MPFLDFIYLANDTSGDGENVWVLIKAWFSIMPAPSGRFISCVLRAEFSSHLVESPILDFDDDVAELWLLVGVGG